MAGGDRREELPAVLVLRIPSFCSNLPSFETLHSLFHLLDPLDSPEPTQSFISRHAREIRAVLCVGPVPLTSETLRLLPNLEVAVCTSAGLDRVDLRECRRRGIAVTNSGPAFAEDVADCAVGLLLDVLRRLSAAYRFVRAGLWPVRGDYPLGHKLGGKRVGIVGLGSIGSLIAQRLVAFGCTVAYNSRKQRPSLPYQFYSNVLDLATNSDVLVLCCALTDETRHVVNKDVMKALGKEGVIINVGRGALIDEKELVQLLVQGEIGGAGFDVYEDEPNVPRELFALDNVVLSPHSAVLTPESFKALQELVVGNLRAFFANQPLLSPYEP